MGEFLYKIGQRTGPAPKIKKIGAVKMGMEQTPVIFKGKPFIVESMTADECCSEQYIRTRNLTTNEISEPFGIGYFFASAFAEDDTLYVFASSKRDNKPMTMYQSDNPEAWHDPRGGHEIRMFKSKDLKTWEEKDIIHCPDRRFWNTSVCKGDGEYLMAIEVCEQEGYDIPEIGNAFTSFFAKSKDLENWTMLPDKYSYTASRYNACPTIRFSGGYYYMICLEMLPCTRFASYIYRTKDLENWEVGFHNPIMMWSDEDRVPKEGCHFTEKEMDILQNGLNINCSDIDLFEYDGRTHIYYANGDQNTYSFLCEAECEMPLADFLKSFFE